MLQQMLNKSMTVYQ